MTDAHPDDLAIDRFAEELKAKMRKNRDRGRSGWENSDWMDACKSFLVSHLAKGDPRDIAIYAMFLWHHNEETNDVPLDENMVSELSQHLSMQYDIDQITVEEIVTDTLNSLGFFKKSTQS